MLDGGCTPYHCEHSGWWWHRVHRQPRADMHFSERPSICTCTLHSSCGSATYAQQLIASRLQLAPCGPCDCKHTSSVPAMQAQSTAGVACKAQALHATGQMSCLVHWASHEHAVTEASPKRLCSWYSRSPGLQARMHCSIACADVVAACRMHCSSAGDFTHLHMQLASWLTQ